MTKNTFRSTLFALLISATLSFGQGYNSFQKTVFTAVATGNPIHQSSIINYHQLQWQVSGSVSSCSVRVDDSADGVSWNAGTIITSQTCTSNGQSSVAAGSANYIRVNVTAFAGTSTPTVTVVYLGWISNPAGGGGGGTVTNVGPITNFAVTSNSTTNVGWALVNAQANTVWGRCTASLGAPSYCSITAAMLPDLSAVYAKLTSPSPANGCAQFTSGTLGSTGSACGAGGGGGGTVSTVQSQATVAPLFSTTVTNPTSTPQINYALTAANARTVFGNCTASLGAPAYCSLTAAMIPDLSTVYQPLLGFTPENVANRGTAYPSLSGGFVPTSQLGSGTADATTCLTGARTYTPCGGSTAAPSGSQGQLVQLGSSSNFQVTNGLSFDPNTATLHVPGILDILGSWYVASDVPATPMPIAPNSQSAVGFDSDGKLKVSENNGAVVEVAKTNSDTSGTAALATNLVGTPGNSKYYGTNGSGTKGYYNLPSGASFPLASTTEGTSTAGVYSDALYPELGPYFDVSTSHHDIYSVACASNVVTVVVYSAASLTWTAGSHTHIASLPASPTDLTFANGDFAIASVTGGAPTSSFTFNQTCTNTGGAVLASAGTAQIWINRMAGYMIATSRIESTTNNPAQSGSIRFAFRDAIKTRSASNDYHGIDLPLIRRGTLITPTNAVGAGQMTVNGAHSAGASTISIAKAAGTSWTAVTGDKITVIRANGNADHQVYTVTGTTVSQGANTTVSVTPNLRTNLSNNDLIVAEGAVAQLGDAEGGETLGPFAAPGITSNPDAGQSPYQTNSTIVNTNLNADMVDGLHATSFLSSALAKQDVMNAPEFCQDGGSTDAYACNLSPAITGYVTGTHYRFKANTANTTVATINFNSVGVATIKKAVGGITTDLATNDIRVGQWVDVVYDGTNMQMQSVLGNAAGTGTVTATGGSLTNNQLLCGAGGVDTKVCNLSGDVATSGTGVATIQAGAVNASKSDVTLTRRVCPLGVISSVALVSTDLVTHRQCIIPAGATLVELNVSGDAGTPNVIVGRNRAGSVVNIVSGALATAASGGIACSNVGGTTGIDGTTTCSATLQNTGLNAGDYLELVSGTPGGTAKEMEIFAVFTIN